MPQLINLARVDAKFGAADMYDTSTVTVDIPSIQIDKTANMDTWYGDVLTYTVVIKNLDENIPATEVKFEDNITPALAKLVLTSVTLDGDPLEEGVDFNYDPLTGNFTIDPIPDIAVAPAYCTLIFRVTKA